jgi:hypothetical protein
VNLTGIIETQINSLSGFVTGKYLTGIIAGTNITVVDNFNGTFTVNSTASGGGGGGGTGVTYVVSGNTGAYIFSTVVQSGVGQQFVSFPTALGNNPYVMCQLTNLSGAENIIADVSGVTSSGYWVNYSNTVDSSGYLLTTIASLSTSTGLATVVIQNVLPNGYAQGNSNYVYTPQPTVTGNNISTIMNWQLSDHFYITLTGNTNVVFTGTQDAMTVMVVSQDTGKGYTITFPTGNGNNFSGLRWQWGTGAIPVQTSGYADVYTFTQFGTGIFASVIQGY